MRRTASLEWGREKELYKKYNQLADTLGVEPFKSSHGVAKPGLSSSSSHDAFPIASEQVDASDANSFKSVSTQSIAKQLGAKPLRFLDLEPGVVAPYGLHTDPSSSSSLCVVAGINATFDEADAASPGDILTHASPQRGRSRRNSFLHVGAPVAMKSAPTSSLQPLPTLPDEKQTSMLTSCSQRKPDAVEQQLDAISRYQNPLQNLKQLNEKDLISIALEHFIKRSLPIKSIDRYLPTKPLLFAINVFCFVSDMKDDSLANVLYFILTSINHLVDKIDAFLSNIVKEIANRLNTKIRNDDDDRNIKIGTRYMIQNFLESDNVKVIKSMLSGQLIEFCEKKELNISALKKLYVFVDKIWTKIEPEMAQAAIKALNYLLQVQFRSSSSILSTSITDAVPNEYIERDNDAFTSPPSHLFVALMLSDFCDPLDLLSSLPSYLPRQMDMSPSLSPRGAGSLFPSVPDNHDTKFAEVPNVHQHRRSHSL